MNSVSFGFDGTHFASGGEDGGVLWEIGGRGVIRYKLQAPVQKVVYNPITHLILSCADGQFGLCTLETKQVRWYWSFSPAFCAVLLVFYHADTVPNESHRSPSTRSAGRWSQLLGLQTERSWHLA